LRALERHIHGGRVLDVGTGSGILAEASRLTGASLVLACDIDDEATHIARANVNSSSIRLFTGSVRSVKSGSVDAVIANLNAASIQAMAGDLRRVVAGGGLIILSGFRTEEQDRVASAMGVALHDRLEQSGWCCLIFSTREVSGSPNERHCA
jgi:ribosomal protein L11 methyltransferase